MFKYLWIFTFIIPYTIWTFFSIKEIYKWVHYESEFKEFWCDASESTVMWVIITIGLLIMVSVASLNAFWN